MDQQRNLILAVVLSVAILIGFEYFIAPKVTPPKPAATHSQTMTPSGATKSQAAAPAKPVIPPAVMLHEALGKSPRVKIATEKLQGSIDLVGARLDDLTLTQYHETWRKSSPLVQLLEPEGTARPYFTEFGWVPAPGAHLKVPTAATRWQEVGNNALTFDHPVTLRWRNGAGLTFLRRIAVDDNYMFTITQTVENHTGQAVTLYPYGLVSRGGKTPVQETRYQHVGPIGVMDGTLHDIDYSDLSPGKPEKYRTTGGWFGLTDPYWLVSLIPYQQESVTVRFSKVPNPHGRLYQVDYTGSAHTVAPGKTLAIANRMFAGAKEVHLLDNYEANLHIPRFDRAIDFGWFYFLTKPIFLILDFLYLHIGNFGLAILVFTLGVKLLFFPLANRSYRSMSKMKLLQPEMKALKERLGSDKTRLNQEMMALYKRHGANPVSGCLPMVIQIPVFFALYKVLYVAIEMRHAPFYGWIHDLSAPDPTSIFNFFGLAPWAVPPHLGVLAFLSIGAWPIIMGVSMFLQQRLNPTSADPMQAKMFMILPIVFTFMLAHFPAGLVIYWAWNNTLSMCQQWLILRQVTAQKRTVKA
ncbi:MAG: membrane protein insertase YidC [Stellaceae bacterium]